MIIVAIRHGQTDDNAAARLQGQRRDLALNKQGINEVRTGVTSLLIEHGRSFDNLYSSPLLRARQTSAIVSQYFILPVIITSEIIEKDFGSLTGLTWNEIGQRYSPDLKTRNDEINFDYRPYGGESVEQVIVRVKEFINMIENKYCSKNNVLLVTHGGVIRIIYKLLELPQPAHIVNGSAHKFNI